MLLLVQSASSLRIKTHSRALSKPLITLGLLLLCFSVLADLPIRDGLEYRKITTPGSQTVHVLHINPHKFTIVPQHAKGQALGLDSLASLAKEYEAIAAINGGFFHAGDGKEGLPAGILKIKNEWYGIAYTNRAAIGWWKNKASVLMDRLQTKTTLKINQSRFPIHAVNRPGSVKNGTLYTAAYGKYTDSAERGSDIVIEHNRIIDIVPSGKTEIPKNGYVYSMGAELYHPVYTPKSQDKVTLNIQVIPEARRKTKASTANLWQTVDHIVGGTPLLIDNGKIALATGRQRTPSDFLDKRHARTAFGILKTGSWVWVVVEKNQDTESIGMTISELANFMKDLGCIQALNLDGGGSSAMYLEDKVVSATQDNDTPLTGPLLRPIADAILILERKEQGAATK